jgi:hypothetical protein
MRYSALAEKAAQVQKGGYMPAVLFLFVVRIVVEVCKWMRQVRANKPLPLCTDCTYAHVQYATNGRLAIACTFAGSVRPVQLDVMFCTDYSNRNVPPRLVSIGFVRDTSVMEPMAKAAPAIP